MQLHPPPWDGPGRDRRPRSVSTISSIRLSSRLPRGAVADRLLVRAWARAHGRELLFVDSNHFLLEATARAFQAVGASCCTATTHDDAVKLLEADPMLRAAIVDYEMTDADAGSLVERLRVVRPSVLLIGTSIRDRRREFSRRGVRRFAPKPWRFADLVEAAGS